MDAADIIELFHERAAIREYECSDALRDEHGGDEVKHRKWAERAAYSDLRAWIGPDAEIPQEVQEIVRQARR